MSTKAPRAEQPDAALLLDSLPVPLLEIGGGNTVLAVNMAAEEFFGMSRQQIKAGGMAEIAPPDHPIFLLLAHLRQRGGSVTEHDLLFSSPRFHHEGVSVQGAEVLDHPDHVLLTFHLPSTARVLDQQQVYRSAARSVSGMAAMLAHEVRNPLSGIKGAAQLLEQAVEGADRDLATLICDEVDRIDALVERMGMFGEAQMDYRALNIHRLLEHVKLLASNGFAKGLRILERYDPSLPHVWGDKDRLVQVLLNLVKNAAEAVQEAGKEGDITLITSYRPGIRVTAPGTTQWRHLPLVVTIRDTGPGISETVKPHLFEPFVSTKVNGSGLGLALVGKVMDDHGGVMEVESRPGRTEISLFLPLAEERGGLS
ncbi:MAG: ATP-binding protein [Acetobacter syzygii]|uniref:two-component system sensor histidine kinase NtrB n=1 Tax=Acetobacter syzygii TaxID=146476 RepID=UPI0039E99076